MSDDFRKEVANWFLEWHQWAVKETSRQSDANRDAEIRTRLSQPEPENDAFDKGFLRAMWISLVLVLCLCLPTPAHARKRNKIIAIGAAVGGAIVAGALASTGNQSQQPTRTVAAHHGMRH